MPQCWSRRKLRSQWVTRAQESSSYRKPKRLVVEGIWKMPSSQVRPFGKAKKINPIPREKDNTSDLELAEMKARAKYAHIRQGDNLNPANNGHTTTAPHGGTT
ncbi:hypothetical protein HWB90_gp069 [Mycobacterium phage Fowlmouth]|uniref:Uncharacterized protein n=2 Tax=Fowlmouthvirus fowlmouth TaxID=2845652 RepID=A0A7G8LQ11_9CAUD|nr:hypothetical protein HWB90_gp069 [Mycobacterium phage Fowlmouth]AYN58070.1 hypothetical protein SEA_FOWLMOUTH_121 [Mycobacterium phage Fowlmouth]QNJ59333.1 hypothetical protein SEA_MRMIYAGI_121 [Mycobacterium phage MrMiyagi]